MWEQLLLAGTGGSIISVGVWELLTWIGRRATERELARRLKRATDQQASESATAVPLRDARYSDLIILDRFIRQFSLISNIARFLQQAGSRITVGAFLLLHVLGFAGSLLLAYWLHLPLPVTGLLVTALTLAPSAAMFVKRSRRMNQLTEQLPEAIHLISSSLRAGLGMDIGLNTVVTELSEPIRGEFAQLVNEALLEFNMNDAFRRFAKRVPLSDYRLFAAAACLHREIGGNFAELLDELEATLRERVRLQRELKTTTALSRFEGLFLGILPVLVSAALFALNPNYYQPFWEDPVGRMLLISAIVLQIIGFGLIRWLIRMRF